MKKLLTLLFVILLVITMSACGKEIKTDAVRFKEEYESLNGVETSTKGVNYRSIEIDKENPFVYSTLEGVNEMIEEEESFIVYFGANWCPWCRSVLPTVIKEAKEAKIRTIYYVNVRPDNDIEKDIRDIYSLDKNNKPYISHEGTEAYHVFLDYAKNILSDYKNQGVTVKNVKRIGAPNFIIVKDGVPTIKITGISKSETDPYMELSDEIIEDMSNSFKEFFEDFLEE